MVPDYPLLTPPQENGNLDPMFKESVTLTIQRPRDLAFEALTDFEKLAEVVKSKVTVERVPDSPKKGVGAAYRIQTTMAAVEPIRCETTEWEPPRLAAFRLDIKDLPTTVSLQFEECVGGTRLTAEVCMEPKSVMYKMMLPMLSQKLKEEKARAVKELEDRFDATA
ncbi:MAG TPA: hypothetical protein DD417_19400 [Elusimicrobia bacterium]|nr:hypothetical protein [Elusimicrobiota bacterium]